MEFLLKDNSWSFLAVSKLLFANSNVLSCMYKMCVCYSVIERLDEHRNFLPLFRDVIDHLMEILGTANLHTIPVFTCILLLIWFICIYILLGLQ